MRDAEFLKRADETAGRLQNIRKPPTGPGKFYGTIDEVDQLNRDFVAAIADTTIVDAPTVAKRLVELNATADSLL